MIGTQSTSAQNQTRIKLNEFVIWDTIIDPTSVACGGSNVSLNGSSRANFVDVTAFTGDSTDPGIANVRSGTSYIINGSSLSGTAAIPTAANVRSGTSVDATTGTLVVPSLANTKTGVAGDGGTGTYDGSDRWTDPGQTNVRSATAYKANSTTNNKTGTLDLPSTSNVKTGVSYDNSGSTGTYDGSDRWSNPGPTNVRSGTAYKANSTSNNQTGSCAVPVAADVRSGVATDATTGTLAGTKSSGFVG